MAEQDHPGWQGAKEFKLTDTATIIGIVYVLGFLFNSTSLIHWINDKESRYQTTVVSERLVPVQNALEAFQLHRPVQALRAKFYVVAGLDQRLDDIGFAGAKPAIAATKSMALDGPIPAYWRSLHLELPPLAMAGKPSQTLLQTSSMPQDEPLQPSLPAALVPLAEQSILILGDSVMGGIAPEFKKDMRSFGFDRTPMIEWKVSSGLGRPDYFNWPAVSQALVASQPVDYAVVLFGTNDIKALKHDGKFIAYDTPEWRQIYDQRVAEMHGILCQKARLVYWLELPPMRAPDLNAGVRNLNQIYETHAQSSSCVRMVPLAALIGGPAGEYVERKIIDGKSVLMRAKDGIHLGPRAGQLVARQVLELILKDDSDRRQKNAAAH